MESHIDTHQSIETHSYSDGTSFKGSIFNGLRHGHGKQSFVDGSVYVGGFANGLADGIGILAFANGSEYCGNLAKGKFNGIGRFVLPSGDVICGEFYEGKLNGKGKCTVKSKKTSTEGIFSEGKLIREEACDGLSEEVRKTVAAVRSQVEANKSTQSLPWQ